MPSCSPLGGGSSGTRLRVHYTSCVSSSRVGGKGPPGSPHQTRFSGRAGSRLSTPGTWRHLRKKRNWLLFPRISSKEVWESVTGNGHYWSLWPWPVLEDMWWERVSSPSASLLSLFHPSDPAWFPPGWWECWDSDISPQGTTADAANQKQQDRNLTGERETKPDIFNLLTL